MTGDGLEEDLPHDIPAERKVLSGMLDDPKGIDLAADILAPEDFYRPAHQVAYRAAVVMRQCGEPVAVETLRDWIAREGDAPALSGARAGEYLLGVEALHVPWEQVPSFAAIVVDRAARRRWIQAAVRIDRHARDTPDIDDMAAAAVAEADAAAVVSGDVTAKSTRLAGAGQFAAAQAGKPPAAVIPGVINAMDRIIVVGAGGSGKTTLALQHAAAASVGIHPFANDRYDPVRVLWIDFEMPGYLAAANLELVMKIARYYGNPDEDGRFQVLHRPRGMNLGERGQAHLLAGLIRKAAPQLVVAGPVYKMHADTGERGDHTGVMNFWDDMRDRYGLALWLETHPAKEGGRFGGGNSKKPTPAGSGRWSDWCEIGFGMVPGTSSQQWDVVPFRGSRDRSRVWPEKLTVNISGGWPWQATYAQGTFGGTT